MIANEWKLAASYKRLHPYFFDDDSISVFVDNACVLIFTNSSFVYNEKESTSISFIERFFTTKQSSRRFISNGKKWIRWLWTNGYDLSKLVWKKQPFILRFANLDLACRICRLQAHLHSKTDIWRRSFDEQSIKLFDNVLIMLRRGRRRRRRLILYCQKDNLMKCFRESFRKCNNWLIQLHC